MSDPPHLLLDRAKQDKHLPGTRNYLEGRSVLTHPDPQALLDAFAGSGKSVNAVPRGMAGFKERVDFGCSIGEYRKKDGASSQTTRGLIVYASGNRAHIIPARP